MRTFDGLRIIRGPLYKSTLLLTVPLLFSLLSTPAGPGPLVVFMFFLNMFLYLCFAYAVNDWADREADLAAGKCRTLSTLPAGAALVIVAAVLLSTVTVGYWLSKSWLYVGVLFGGLFLGMVYSTPPWRLKGRGIWGILIAPVLGKAIPVLLACVLYRRFGWYALVIVLAEFIKNAIDILFHQIVDYENDKRSDIRTYPVAKGLEPAGRLLHRLVTAGTLSALTMGLILALLVAEYRWVLGAALVLAVPAAAMGRRWSSGLRAGHSALHLPLTYLWFGGIVFLHSPLWLSAIAAWRDLSFLPLALAVAAITVSQTVFYLRYRYY